MHALITQSANLRNTQIAGGGMEFHSDLPDSAPMTNGLRAARKRINVTQEQMAERLEVSSAQISRWETGKNDIPRKRWADLCEAYGAPIEELIATPFSLPPADARKTNATVLHYERSTEPSLVRDVPIYGTSLGAPLDFEEKAIEQTMLNTGEVISYLPRPAVLNGQLGAYGLYVQGSSMSPRFDDGDTIFVQDSRQGRPPRIGDDVVVYLRDKDEDDGLRAVLVLVKRLVRRSASYVELEQFNPAVTFKLDAADVLRIDRVIPWRELLS